MCYGAKKLEGADGWKQFYEDHEGDYWDAEEEAWNEYLNTYAEAELKGDGILEPVKKLLAEYRGKHYVDDLTQWAYEKATSARGGDMVIAEALVDVVNSINEEFEFPSQDEWVNSEYASAIGSYEDRCYDEWRDSQMEL